MKTRWFTAAVVMFATFTFAPTFGHAQTTAPGPYYAVPAWDQTLPSNTRFIVLSNMGSAAVLDRETGLVWERTPINALLAWQGAKEFCISKTVGSRKGWRLPTIQELSSLVDPTVTAPTLSPGHPFTISVLSDYWTASSHGGDDSVWVLAFVDGNPITSSKTSQFPAWCVRGGQGVDPQ